MKKLLLILLIVLTGCLQQTPGEAQLGDTCPAFRHMMLGRAWGNQSAISGVAMVEDQFTLDQCAFAKSLDDQYKKSH